MPGVTDILFRSREEILDEMVESGTTLIPDMYTGVEGILMMIFTIVAGVAESVFQANQIVADDMFVQTASDSALQRYSDEFGIPLEDGTPSSGSLLFTGDGGTVIKIGTEVAYDSGTGDDALYFLTTEQQTIPDPGVPSAPNVVVNVAAGNLTGLYEYAITFVTASGETEIGDDSSGINPVAQKADLTAIPLGGPGTTKRRIYRQKDASGVWGFVHEIADNTTTIYTDNIADGSIGGTPPSTDTAHSIAVAAQSEENGDKYNVLAGSITILTDAPDGATGVTNPAPFTGGTDEEGIEDYRSRLGNRVRAPQTGSAIDLKVWAEEDEDVDIAAVFKNDNAGTPTNGHVTVRIAGPGGSVPDSGVIARVLADLENKDLANATIHVLGFTQVSTNIDVDITPDSGYTTLQLTPMVTNAITSYIDNLQIGEDLMVAGLVDSVFGLPGVLDVVVNTPSANLATADTEKRIVGTVTVGTI